MKRFKVFIALVLVGSLFLTGCQGSKTKGESTDIVIVGAGLSGIMAGMELIRNHPDVNFILLEQMPSIGGSLSATGGAIYGTDSKWHQEQNKVSTVEDLITYFEESSQTQLNRELLRNVFSLSGQTFDWVEEIVPLVDELKPASPYSDKLYTAWADGRGMEFYAALSDYVATLEIDLRLNASVTELIVEEGSIKGVKVNHPDGDYDIQAQNVILTTGGFGQNDALMEKYAPGYAAGIKTVAPGANGDGIIFVEEFETDIIGDGTMGTFYASNGDQISALPFMVDQEGKRFVNESDLLYRIQRVLVDDADGQMFLLTDSKYEKIDDIKSEEAYQEYNSLEELAGDLDLDLEILTNEINNYNQALENNQSPGFGLPVEKAHPIRQAPFYAGHALVRTFGTIPGIEINPSMQVVAGDKKPIPNLYAAGELTAGNAFSHQYPGAGIGISYACNSGRLAAINAAETIQN